MLTFRSITITISRSSRPDLFCKKSVFRIFTKFTGKHLCQGLFFNKVAGLKHKCFPINIAKFLRTPILKSTKEPLLLMAALSCYYIHLIYKSNLYKNKLVNK